MTVVLHPDGALGVGLGGSIDLPPEQVYGCLAETLRVAFTGVRPPKQTALFSRTVGDPNVILGDELDRVLPQVTACVFARLPAKVECVEVRVQVTSAAGRRVDVRAVSIERPGALPPHDGRKGAACAWGSGVGPRPTPCRQGLICRVCPGGIQRQNPSRSTACVSLRTSRAG